MPSQTGSIDLTAQVSANNNAKDYSDIVVDNLEIGGRNLLLNSKTPLPTLAPYSNSVTSKYNTPALDGVDYYYCSGARYWRIDFPTLISGETYNLWFDIARSADSKPVFVKIGSTEQNIGTALARDWKRLGLSFVASMDTYAEIRVAIDSTGTQNDYIAALRNVKLEKGDKATDWTPSPEDQEALVTSTRTWYATCDTAAATVAKVATTTDDGFELHDGVVVDVKFTNTNSGAVGSLTLNVNDTGAKSIKTMYNNSLANLTTAGQLYAGLVVRFVYSGTYWIAATNYNSDTVDRKRINNAVMVAENVTAYAICGRSGTGHKKLVSGLAIDISYPIAYLSAGNISGQSYAVASGGTATTFYTAIPGVNLQSTKASWTGTQYAMCYIKGTLSGSTFTVHSDVFTTIVPTSDDGLAYIPIGMMVSTYQVNFDCDNTVYAYRNGKFQKFDTVANYITADSSGIKIHMAGNSSTYQHQTADATTFYVASKKRSQVAADGLHVYVDTTETEVAKFTADGAQIGKTGSSRILQDYHSMQMVDKDDNVYFYVSDLRGTNGTAEIIEYFTGDGVTRAWVLSFTATNTNYTILVSDSSGGDSPYKSVTGFQFSTAPTSGAQITVTYQTESNLAKAYTFGVRRSGSSAHIGPMSVVEGRNNVASGQCSHAEGSLGTASGDDSHSEGRNTTASGGMSHSEGYNTTASGYISHSEGGSTTASGSYSHAEGYNSTAYSYSHAEGNATEASGVASHAEGYGTKTIHGLSSTPQGAHAEGYYSEAHEGAAHAEGMYTLATERGSHAEGYYSEANALYAHAQNFRTLAGYYSQTVIGKCNSNQSDTAFEIGNGTSNDARSNAATIDWNGNYIGQAMAGIIQMFAGATAPTGWLICDGSAVSRETYATLFAAIGTTWGAGNGSTTFNVPDLRGRMPMGAGTGSGLTARTLGGKVGAETHNHGGNSGEVTLSAAQSGLPAHTHAFTQPTVSTTLKFEKNVAAGSDKNRLTGGNDTTYDTTTVYNASVSGGAVGAVTGGAKNASSAHKHTISSNANIPPAAVVNFIICTGKTS